MTGNLEPAPGTEREVISPEGWPYRLVVIRAKGYVGTSLLAVIVRENVSDNDFPHAYVSVKELIAGGGGSMAEYQTHIIVTGRGLHDLRTGRPIAFRGAEQFGPPVTAEETFSNPQGPMEESDINEKICIMADVLFGPSSGPEPA